MLTFWPLVTDMTTFNKYIDVRLSSGGYFYNARKIKKLYCVLVVMMMMVMVVSVKKRRFARKHTHTHEWDVKNKRVCLRNH